MKRPWPLLLLMLAYVLNFLDRQLVGILGQPIKADLHLSDTALGLLSGVAFALFYTALGLPIARLAERRGRVGVLAAALGFWSVMTALCGAARTLPLLVLARLGVGVGEAGFVPVAQSLIAAFTPRERRATALSIFSLGIPLGMLAAAVGGGWLATALGWRLTFVLLGLPGLVLALILPRVLTEPPVEPATADHPTLAETARLMWRTPALRHMAAGATAASFAGYGLTSFAVPLLMRAYQLPLATAATGFGIVAALGIGIGIGAGGWLSDRQQHAQGPARIALVGTLVAGLLFSFALGLPDVYMMAVAAFAPLIGAHLYFGPVYAMTVDSVPPRARATAIALLLILMNGIGLGLGPLIVGATSDAFAAACGRHCADPSAEGLSSALRLDVLVYFLAAFHFWCAKRVLRQPQPHNSVR